jgi:DNA-binding LacI/PurR family transcriptional regulator
MSVPVTLPTVVPTPVSTPVPVLPTAEPDLAALRLPAALALSAAGGAPPTPPTLAMVAEEAGVSAATASRVLNGSPRVRPATRRLVKDAMERLGYVRNRAARSNQTTGRTGFIALVVCEEGLRMFSDPFFPRALRGVTKALAPNRVHLVLITVHSARDHAAATQFVRAGHVDGAIYVSMHGRLFVEPEHLGVPVVLFGRPAVRRRGQP